MIEIREHRLNPRYYAGPVKIDTNTSFDYRADAASTKASVVIEAWLERLQPLCMELGACGCKGNFHMDVTGPLGYTTNGQLLVFDKASLANAQSVVLKIYAVLDDYPRSVEGFRFCCTFLYNIKQITLLNEGVSVSLSEIDTEHQNLPVISKVVTISSVHNN